MNIGKLYLALFIIENTFDQINANRIDEHSPVFMRSLQASGKCKNFQQIPCSRNKHCPGYCNAKSINSGDDCTKKSDCQQGKCVFDKCIKPKKYCGDTDKECNLDAHCHYCSAKSPKAGSQCKKHRDCVKGVGRCLKDIKCEYRTSTSAPTDVPTNAPINAPTAPPTIAPTAPPTIAPTNKNISPVGTGKSCTSNSECVSNYCEPTTNICYKSPICKAIKHDQGTEFDENHALLIFVGSGFNNLNDWAAKVDNTYSVFEKYDFFKAGVAQFSAFYVNKLESSFCYFNCGGIDRLLCCNINKAKALASSCFPTVSTVQTIVVHNDAKYGGAGYIGANVATTSINLSAPLVAVHELGHSMFEFYDEYTYQSGDSLSGPNCDSAGCSKWNDIIDDYPSICSYKGCANGNYYVGSSSSFMKSLNYQVGPVLTRYTCCSYYAMTGAIPQYCDEFVNKGMGLIKYCGVSGYSPDASLLSHMQGVAKSSFETPGGQKIYLSDPAEITLKVEEIESSTDGVFINSIPQSMQSGFYSSSLMDGEKDDIEYMVQVKVTFESRQVKQFDVSKFYKVEVPPTENDGVESVRVKKETLNIVYDYEKYGDVASIEVRNSVA